MATVNEDGLAPHYRMPAVLGPAPGPRNMPAAKAHLLFSGQMHMISMRAACDATALGAVIPPDCAVREAMIEVQVIQLLNLGWLAGRGYNIVAVRVPVTCRGRDYVFTPVLWESAADPVLTGREELGSPKLFADVPTPRKIEGGYAGHATWDGFRFFDYEVSSLVEDSETPAAGAPNLLYKYFPRTGEWGSADVAHHTIAVAGDHPAPRLLVREKGAGRFAFSPARWEDMPTQFSFVNRLAHLPVASSATVSVTLTDGIADLRAQRILPEETGLPGAAG